MCCKSTESYRPGVVAMLEDRGCYGKQYSWQTCYKWVIILNTLAFKKLSLILEFELTKHKLLMIFRWLPHSVTFSSEVLL